MKIIVLGGNQVGGTLAEELMNENHDVTVVDIDAEKLKELHQRLDIGTVHGFASYPDILQKAGAEDADLLIAVTSNDEVNLVACQAAYSLFNVPTKIARVRAKQYLDYPRLFADKDLPVNVFINPEQLVTEHIQRLIEHPGTLQVLDFAEGKAKMLAISPIYGGPLINKTIAEIYKFMKVDARVVAIFQGDHPIPPDDSTIIQVADEVFFLTADQNASKALGELGRLDHPYQRIMITANDSMGATLASAIENKFQTKLITDNKPLAEECASTLNNTTVLYGDPADRQLLINENIEYIDIFCAVTNDDENNIMSCMLAKQLGARRTMCLIRHATYVDLIEGGDIDIAISPQQASINSILRYVRQGDIVNVYSLRRGAAEAIEIIAHGDQKTSKVVGRAIKKLSLPKSTTIGAVVRADKVIMATEDLVIESEDHVILFVMDKKHIHQIEKLFQVSVGFFKKAK